MKLAEMTDKQIEACWFSTYTGTSFHFFAPKPEEICLTDIAHALALKTRFNGMCKHFYSVAEHSVRCADYLLAKYKSRPIALAGLMHDTGEAYLPDVTRPLKEFFPIFTELEDIILEAVCKKFKVTWPLPPEYKEADDTLLMTEASILIDPASFAKWRKFAQPIAPEIEEKMETERVAFGGRCWDPQHSEYMFLNWYNRLCTLEVTPPMKCVEK